MVKRAIDLVVAAVVIAITWPVQLLLIVIQTVNTRMFGVFSQVRIGLHGQPFTIYKLRTMRRSSLSSTVTRDKDPRLTRTGRLLRTSRLDELPQAWNVLKGDMSLVGPRPDVAGFADLLDSEHPINQVRPGVTGPASLFFRKEELLIHDVDDVDLFAREVIWPQKVLINEHYVARATILDDVFMMYLTVFPDPPRLERVLLRWGVPVDSLDRVS